MEAGVVKIYLIDHDFTLPGKCDWYHALNAVFGVSFQANSALDGDDPPETHDGYNNVNALIFAHSRQSPKWKDKADLVSATIVLVHSAGGHAEERNVKGNLHGCYWSPQDFQSTKRPEIARFIKQVLDDVPASEIDWSLLKTPRSEEFLALRLLCEARRECGDSQKIDIHGFTIHAPVTVKDWLTPFGKADESQISGLASLMGTGEIVTKAEAVFNAVKEHADLSTPITEFLKVFPVQPTKN